VEVPEEVADRVIEALSRTRLRGRRITVKPARPGAGPDAEFDDDAPPLDPSRSRRPSFRSQRFHGKGRRSG
jgi:hypothetical protein